MTKAPPLRDDCFVMPRGVHWTPVDEALEKLHQSLKKMVITTSPKTTVNSNLIKSIN